MSKTAVVIGATGLVGGILLSKLLNDNRYTRMLVLGRSSSGIEHPKLEEITGILLEPDFWQMKTAVDDVFCCVGTTRAKTSDLSLYKQIDMGIPVHAAQWGLANGMNNFLVISAMGANKNSRIFYSRIKGQMEEALLKMKIPQLYILRPSLIIGNRKEFRFGEKLGIVLAKVFSPLIPSRYKGIQAETIADAMIHLANDPADQKIYESGAIRSLVN